MAISDLVPWRKRSGRRDLAATPMHEMRDLFDTFEDFFDTGLAPWSRRGPDFGPAVDVTETKDEYKVSVELPGMSRDDVDLTVDQGRLQISGEKKQEKKDEGEDYLRVERSYGSFSRSIPLPANVDEDKIAASFKNGVLTIHVPKTEEARGKRVEIQGD